MSSANFARKILVRFSKEITDQVFQMVENDRKLLQEYLRLISNENLDTVNRVIGKAVKKEYKLENAATREANPKSKLIKSYQRLKLKH